MVDFTDKLELKWSDRTLSNKLTTSVPLYYYQSTSHLSEMNSPQHEKSVQQTLTVSGAVSYHYVKLYITFILSLTVIKIV